MLLLLLLFLLSTRGHHHHLQADQDVHLEVDAGQPVLRHVQQGGQRGRQHVVRAVAGQASRRASKEPRSGPPEPATWLEVLTRLLSLPAGQLLRRVPDGGREPGEQRDLPRGDGGEPGPLAQDHPGSQVSESEADQEALPLPHHRRRAGEEQNCSSQEIYFVFAL